MPPWLLTVRPRAPWYTDEIASAKYLRRKLEHKWLNSKVSVNYMAYKQQCQQVNSMLLESKYVYYNSKINEASGNQKELFTILNKVLTVKKEPQLPCHSSLAELTDRFADFFMSKILDIREQLKKSLRTPPLPTDQNDFQWNTKVCLLNFEPASVEEIFKLIRDSPNKSCSLDPIPTWLAKMYWWFSSVDNVNLSLSTGKMPGDIECSAHSTTEKYFSRPRNF